MPKIEVYSSLFCPFCFRAKRLLKQKDQEFEEIDVLASPGRKKEMVERAGGKTSVPQIFIDGQHIGGCDELYALEAAGKLDPMLQGGAR
jgi:glutaredoxin 3